MPFILGMIKRPARKPKNTYFQSAKQRLGTTSLLALMVLSGVSIDAFSIDGRLRVGVVRPMTGPMQPIGDELMNGIEIAHDKIKQSKNKELASLIRVFEADDEGKGSTAATAALSLINKDRVHILIGSISNTLNDSITDVAARKKRLIILPIGTSPSLTSKGSNVYSMSLSEPQQGAALGKFARTVLNKSNALILEEKENPYSQSLGSNFANSFKKFGGNNAMRNTFESSVEGIKAISAEASQIAHDLAFIPTFYPDARQLIKRLQNRGLKSTFIGGDGWDTFNIKNTFGSRFPGLYYYTPYTTDDPHPALQKFVKAYQDKFKKMPSLAAFAGYEAFNLATFAYRKVKSNRTGPLASFLKQAKKLPSLSGPIKMNSSRTPNKPATIMVTTPQGSQFMTKVTL